VQIDGRRFNSLARSFGRFGGVTPPLPGFAPTTGEHAPKAPFTRNGGMDGKHDVGEADDDFAFGGA
jgi:hypothetical protein